MNNERMAYELGYQFAEFLDQRMNGTRPEQSSSLKRTIYRRHPNGDVEVVEINNSNKEAR